MRSIWKDEGSGSYDIQLSLLCLLYSSCLHSYCTTLSNLRPIRAFFNFRRRSHSEVLLTARPSFRRCSSMTSLPHRWSAVNQLDSFIIFKRNFRSLRVHFVDTSKARHLPPTSSPLSAMSQLCVMAITTSQGDDSSDRAQFQVQESGRSKNENVLSLSSFLKSKEHEGQTEAGNHSRMYVHISFLFHSL